MLIKKTEGHSSVGLLNWNVCLWNHLVLWQHSLFITNELVYCCIYLNSLNITNSLKLQCIFHSVVFPVTMLWLLKCFILQFSNSYCQLKTTHASTSMHAFLQHKHIYKQRYCPACSRPYARKDIAWHLFYDTLLSRTFWHVSRI